jgi:hypothetical protein
MQILSYFVVNIIRPFIFKIPITRCSTAGTQRQFNRPILFSHWTCYKQPSRQDYGLGRDAL